jgi:hypothetical protein
VRATATVIKLRPSMIGASEGRSEADSMSIFSDDENGPKGPEHLSGMSARLRELEGVSRSEKN